MRWNGRGEVVWPYLHRGQSLESRLAAQPSVLRAEMSKPILTTSIFVALLDEGTDCWRPVEAVREGEWFRILSSNPDPRTERWEFEQGELVGCRTKAFSDGRRGLVAFERAEAQVKAQ